MNPVRYDSQAAVDNGLGELAQGIDAYSATS
jgi:hypothetical protein